MPTLLLVTVTKRNVAIFTAAGRFHRPLDPRAARDARQPRAVVRDAAVDITAAAVIKKEGVEVEQQPVDQRAVTLL